MKYSMVVINTKIYKDEDDYIHRVLIEYATKEKVENSSWHEIRYGGTRIVEVDPYFKAPSNPHQYKFNDDDYYLTRSIGATSFLVNLARKYNYFAYDDADYLPIEFEANSDEEAIEIFIDERIDHYDGFSNSAKNDIV